MWVLDWHYMEIIVYFIMRQNVSDIDCVMSVYGYDIGKYVLFVNML